MVEIRIIYPVMYGEKQMRIYNVPEGQNIAYLATASKIMITEWINSVIAIGGLDPENYTAEEYIVAEETYINSLGITLVLDFR